MSAGKEAAREILALLAEPDPGRAAALLDRIKREAWEILVYVPPVPHARECACAECQEQWRRPTE